MENRMGAELPRATRTQDEARANHLGTLAFDQVAPTLAQVTGTRATLALSVRQGGQALARQAEGQWEGEEAARLRARETKAQSKAAQAWLAAEAAKGN